MAPLRLCRLAAEAPSETAGAPRGLISSLDGEEIRGRLAACLQASSFGHSSPHRGHRRSALPKAECVRPADGPPGDIGQPAACPSGSLKECKMDRAQKSEQV